MKKPHVLFWTFCLLCSSAFAQKDITASATIDKTAILIGEPAQLTLEATFSKAHTPSFFILDSLPHFEILSRSKIDTQAAATQTILKQTVTVTSWDSGTWAIPALSLTEAKGALTKPLVITVGFTPMKPGQDYHDIKDIIPVTMPRPATWYWYLISAGLLLLIILLLFPKKKKEPEAETTLIAEGAYKRAMNSLDTLKQNNTLDNKAYFTELVRIFRTYLQQAKGIHSFQQTTDDLSRQLQPLQLPHEDFKKLVEALQLSDFVKFARYNATANEREGAWNEIKKSITTIEHVKT